MVLSEDVAAFVLVFEGLVHFSGQMQLLSEPDRHTDEELFETARRIGDVCFEQPFELEEGFFVKYDVIKVLGAYFSCFEAVVERICGELEVVFFSCEAFLLCGGDDLAVADECGGAIMVESGNS